MIDHQRSGRCRHIACPMRAIRAGVCLQHWQQLNGTAPAPWPADLKPRTGREYTLRAMARRYTPAPQ